MKPIDLGRDYDEIVPVSLEEVESKRHYPAFHIEGDENVELPHEGTMLIKFRKTSSSESESRGEKRYSCTVEVHKILSVKANEEDEAPTKKYSGAEDALDKLMSEVTGRKSNSKAY